MIKLVMLIASFTMRYVNRAANFLQCLQIQLLLTEILDSYYSFDAFVFCSEFSDSLTIRG